MQNAWSFSVPEDTEVITLGRILSGDSHLLLVSHDEDDDGWQFLDGEQVFEEDGVVVHLGEMVQFDPTLLEIADLPAGSYAWRSRPDQPWTRAVGEPPARLPS